MALARSVQTQQSGSLQWQGLPFSTTEQRKGLHLDELVIAEPMLWVMRSGSALHSWCENGVQRRRALVPETAAFKQQGHRVTSFHVAGGYVAHLMLFPPESVARLLEDQAPTALHQLETLGSSHVESDAFTMQAMRTIAAEIDAGCPRGAAFAESISIALLTYLAGRWAASPLPPASALSESRIRLVREFIEAHLCEDVSLTRLAAVANLSPRHLARSFASRVGLSVHQYILARKIERAKRLLRLQPATAVAMELNFASHSHFTATFRRATGVTPSEYKRLPW